MTSAKTGPQTGRSGLGRLAEKLTNSKEFLMTEDMLNILIDNFDFHVSERQIKIAQILSASFRKNVAGDPLTQSGFAILSIIMSYFEMIAQFDIGESSTRQSPSYFVKGFRKVYLQTALLDDELMSIYGMVRNGMYHTALPYKFTALSRHPKEAFSWDNSILIVNPAQVTDDVAEHFQSWIIRLRDITETVLRKKFETMMEKIQYGCPFPERLTCSTTPAPYFPQRLREIEAREAGRSL